MIRPCGEADFETILEVINDGAAAYRGVIPPAYQREPYMTAAHLKRELTDGVVFHGLEEGGTLCGVMGMQDRGDVTLIRHAYVRTAARRRGIGTRLLRHLESRSSRPILVGTWRDASWAIDFYRRNGYRAVTDDESRALLETYWSIREEQIATSVVLAGPGYDPPDGPVSIERGYLPGAVGRVVELHGTYYHDAWAFGSFFEATVAREIGAFVGRLDGERDGFWTASLDGRIVGSVSIDGLDAAGEGAHLRWFILADGLRGKGVGTRLLRCAVAFCRERKHPRVTLWTFAGLDAARRLYESFGFRLVEERRGSRWGTEVSEQRFELPLA